MQMKCIKCGGVADTADGVWLYCATCTHERARLYIVAQIGLMDRLARLGSAEARKRRVEYISELQEQGR